jgi:hypothetical protein
VKLPGWRIAGGRYRVALARDATDRLDGVDHNARPRNHEAITASTLRCSAAPILLSTLRKSTPVSARRGMTCPILRHG